MSQLIDLKITELRQSITKSGLNFLLRESPFGLKIELRKSLARPTTTPQGINPSITLLNVYKNIFGRIYYEGIDSVQLLDSYFYFYISNFLGLIFSES